MTNRPYSPRWEPEGSLRPGVPGRSEAEASVWAGEVGAS